MSLEPGKTCPFAEVVQDLDLDQRLVMEPLLVADNLDGDKFTGCVVTTLEHLTKRAFAERADDFIAVRQMIVVDDEVVTSVVIVPMIVGGVVQCRVLLLATGAEEIHLFEIENLLALVLGKVLDLRAPEQF
jgi:hypothetical protein